MERKTLDIRIIQTLVLSAIICIASALVAPASFAGEVDILINKLVEKGVLTRSDAEAILAETKQEATKAKEETKEVKVPDWVQKTKLYGDLRLRYQYEDREGKDTRERGRYRFRLGAETKIIDVVKVGFGLASGNGDPRSTNQTFTNSFEKPTLRIDYAFAEFKPAEWLRLTGGKFHNALWKPSDLLWDSDITPEGASAQLSLKAAPRLDVFLNTAFFVIDENGTGGDPYMYAFQPGIHWKITDAADAKLAFVYYGFQDVQGSKLDNSSGTNTLTGGLLAFDYDTYGMSGEIALKKPLGDILPYLALFGEYITNPDPSDDDQGYIAGLRLGHQKVSDAGNWQLEYSYRRLERDAWLDIFPDSDFYGGETNVKGHEVILSYGLAKNVGLAADYYHTENIRGDRKTEDLLQIDLNFKF